MSKLRGSDEYTPKMAFKGLCFQKGLKLWELGEAVGLSLAGIYHRVDGTTPWRFDEAQRVCKALGITLDEFAQYYPA